jgi:hypothetical protein
MAETSGDMIEWRYRTIARQVLFQNPLHSRQLADRLGPTSAPPMAAARLAMSRDDLPAEVPGATASTRRFGATDCVPWQHGQHEGETQGAFQGTQGNEHAREVVHPRCCGIEVHKASLCGCISIKDSQLVEKVKAAVRHHQSGLRELAAWLRED